MNRSVVTRWRGGLAPVLLLLAGCCSEASAGLEWKRTEEKVTMPSPVTTSIISTFEFRNTGTQAVRVQSITEGCATCKREEATFDKEVYAPGESGVLTLTIKVWRGSGLVKREFEIMTDEKPPSKTTIRLDYFAPAYLAAKPDWLYWNIGELAEPKTIRLTADVKEPMHVLEVRSTPNGFKHEFVTRTEGREYELTVVPDNTAKLFRQRFTLMVARADEPPFDMVLNAVVLPRQAGAGQAIHSLIASERFWTALICLLGVAGVVLIGWLLRRFGLIGAPRRPEAP